MQPNPIAETSKLLFPSLRFRIFNFLPVELDANSHHFSALIARAFAEPVTILLRGTPEIYISTKDPYSIN